MSRLPSLLLALLLATAVPIPAAFAQEGGQAAAQQSGGDAQTGATVQVGAGTAAAVTTGDSGEAAVESDAPEESGPPPLPSAELCSAYEGQPEHAACLATVLLEEEDGGES